MSRQPNRKSWGRHTRQTVYRHRGKPSNPYFITQQGNIVQVNPNEVDDLILALIEIRSRGHR